MVCMLFIVTPFIILIAYAFSVVGLGLWQEK
jgi:hypothetical protein